MISIRSGVLVAVNRPPGCGSISAIWLSGLAGSGFGLLGLTEATSKAAAGAAAGSCADAAVAASRMARAKPHVEGIIFMSTPALKGSRMTNAAQRPGRQRADRERQQGWRQYPDG